MKKEEKVDIHCMKYPICKFCPKDSVCNKEKEKGYENKNKKLQLRNNRSRTK